MLSVEKPGSPEEVLEHFGKKGMKWGVRTVRTNRAGEKAGRAARKAELTKGGRSQFRVGHRPRDYGDVRRANKAATAAKKAKKAELKEAYRKEVAARPPKAPQKGVALGRASREFRAQNPTGKLQARAIRSAQKESYAREKAIKKMKKVDSVEAARMQRDHMNHPGTAVALRSTRGEKVAATILLASIRKDLPLTTATGVGIGVGRLAERRRIERTQRKGGFK